MFSKRLLFGHGTVVAYVSLFIALGGSGYAATRIASAASSAPVKVRCSATHAGRKVSCKVVKGSGVGPRGRQGPPGKNGNNGASGPTTYSQPPAFTFVEQTPGVPASSSVSVNFGTLQDDEWQNIALYTSIKQDIPASTPGQPIVQTLINGPTEFEGSTSHFYSGGFCYGGQLNQTDPTSAQLTHVALVEYVENNGPVPTNTFQPPQYTTVTLWSAPITNAAPATASGAGGCLTFGPSSPVAIQPNGFLALWITPTFSAPDSSTSGVQISFGRITTSFGP
jgi:hypothetical protein